MENDDDDDYDEFVLNLVSKLKVKSK